VQATKLKNIVLLLLASLLLGGCAVRVAYHFLDIALLWSLDDYIEFEGSQRAEAKSAIKEFHRWHRYNELPGYAVQLDALADDLEGPVTAQTMGHYGEMILAAWQNLMRGMALPSAKILSQLNDSQVQELIDRVAEEEREDLDDYKHETEEEAREERIEFMENGARKLAGRLNDEQRAMIKTWAASVYDMGQMSIEHRSLWRRNFTDILQDRSDESKLEQELTALYTQPYLFWNEEYQQSMDYNEGLTLKLLADLANSMTDKQRRHATRRLRAFADDFKALSKED
jgi:ASC-1-like (ASCH) protein